MTLTFGSRSKPQSLSNVFFLVNALPPKPLDYLLQTLQVHRSHDVGVLGNIFCDLKRFIATGMTHFFEFV